MTGTGWGIQAAPEERAEPPREEPRQEPAEEPAEEPLRQAPAADVDAERATLGAMLTAASEIDAVASVLTGGDFYRPAHEAIFDAITRLHEEGKPVTPILVNDYLTRTGQIGMAGGQAYTFELWTNGREGTGEHHALLVAEAATRRRLHAIGLRVQQQAAEPGVEPGQAVDEAFTALEAALRGGAARPLAFGETIDATLDALSETVSYLPTPWPSLNHIIGGLRPGNLYVIAARPAVGKSMAALNIAQHVVASGPVVFFSLEMSNTDLQIRAVASDLRIPLGRLASRELTDTDWAKIRDRRAAWQDVPLYINDDTGTSIHEIRKYAQTIHQRTPLAALIVDYLQLMSQPQGDRRSRQEFVADMSRQLKVLANKLGVPVIALSQLNRGSEGRADKRPALHDLRESGAIEQDADVVILLHSDPDSPDKDGLEMIIAKNRHGTTDTIELARWGHYSRIEEQGHNPLRGAPTIQTPERRDLQ